MLQFNKINKLKIILLSLCTVLSVSLFAQNEKTTEESTIVMTQSELNSFLNAIADARRSKLKEKETRKEKEYLNQLRLKYKQRSEMEPSTFESGNISNQQILRELRSLNQRIDNLNSNNKMSSMGRDNSTIIIPGNSNPNTVYREYDRNSTTFIPENNSVNMDTTNIKIKELQEMIDSLTNVEKNLSILKKNNSLEDSLVANKTRLNALKRKMDSLEMKMQETNNSNKTEEFTQKSSYFKQQVYFDNNSEQLRTNYYTNIRDLTQILIDYPDAKIMLEGWASPVGNTTYNKQLSMRRAESVENAFINNGIAANRIITAFRGEDKSTSEQQARRVDISIILK